VGCCVSYELVRLSHCVDRVPVNGLRWSDFHLPAGQRDTTMNPFVWVLLIAAQFFSLLALIVVL
jgi:hypothetical protein